MRAGVSSLLPALLLSLALGALPTRGESLATANDRLLEQLREVLGLEGEQLERVRSIFAYSGFIGQGNPAISEHPMTPEECRERQVAAGVDYENPEFEAICGDRYMAPLYDPDSEAPEAADACIDRFEFPNIPGVYPVVWVRASEAAELCEAVGKRICDAHEWEGACAGRLLPPDYPFELAAGQAVASGVRRMRLEHNRRQAGHEVWSYGAEYRTGICAAASKKTASCDGASWGKCGSNTYPVGCFPECGSSLGVQGLHGNAAEHMNLPLAKEQMANRGSVTLGYTEMKGSWFIFDSYKAHQDHCRWRAPFWHGTRVRDERSHRNYHLGFRCCKTIGVD